MLQLQCPALVLSGEVVYAAFGSHADNGLFHGWLMGYDAATLTQTSVWNTTPNGIKGAIWRSVAGVTVDTSGNLYMITGNRTFDVNTGGKDFGDSVI